MSKERICFRGSDGDVSPVKCIYLEGEFGYPYYCKDEKANKSEQMFENEHFLNYNDAWRSITDSVKADVNLSARAVIHARENLLKIEKEASDSEIGYLEVSKNVDNPFRATM